MIVVDNNIIVGFAIPTDAFNQQAGKAFDADADWNAPELCRSEFRSVARNHLLKGESPQNLIECGRLAASIVTTHAVTDAEVFEILAKAPKLSSYDAEYVALARRLGCKLVTTDAEVLKHQPAYAIHLAAFIQTA